MRAHICFLGALALLTACSRSAADAPITDQWRAVAIESRAVTFENPRVGGLVFRGGVELSARDRAFGGFSGQETLDDRRLLAITDRGAWFEFTLDLSDDGALTGVSFARTAPMRDEEGRTFPTKPEGDAEGITQLADGRFAVSFEQNQRIRIYDLYRDGPFGASVRGPTLEGAYYLPNNAGLEAIVALPSGELLVGAEGGASDDTALWRAPLDAAEEVPAFALYPLSHGYGLTSFDRLPDGAFVALERFWAPVIGARARIMRLELEGLETGGAFIGLYELAVLSAPMPVDNFEGVTATRAPDGATRLYIISDDNFSDRQRTLLLAFDIVEE